MKRSTPKKKYRVDFKVRALAALDANDGRIYRTANQLGVPRSTLRDWDQHRDELHLEVEQQRKQRGLLLEDRLEMMIEQIANTMQEKTEKTTLLESIRGMKLLIELHETLATKRAAAETTRGTARAKLAQILERYAVRDESEDEEPSAEDDGAEYGEPLDRFDSE